jgi:hypothetical protein
VTYGGWTCQSCGAYVPNGCTHSCSMAVRWQNPPPDPVLTRLADALERIATALEKGAAP